MARSDVAVNAAQIGTSGWNVIGFIILSWCGSLAEETFFRGLLFLGVWQLFGGRWPGAIIGIVITVVLFGAAHGYQGWAGIIDTALYGGLTMTILYLWRERLLACIVAHGLWNTIATLVLYSWNLSL